MRTASSLKIIIRERYLARLLLARYYVPLNLVGDYLFSRFHNGLLKAYEVPPLDRLFTIPRLDAIQQLADKYPIKYSITSTFIESKLKSSDSDAVPPD